MNEDGGWVVTKDDSEALTMLTEDEGGYMARVVKVTVKMTAPAMDETTVDVPDGAGTIEAQPETE